MSNANKMTSIGKRATALILLLFFCFTAVAKGFSVKAPVLKSNGCLKSKTWLTGKTTEASISALDAQDDNDADDIDFVVLPDFSLSPAFATEVFEYKNTAHSGTVTTQAYFHLYDLYCNWKSHLS